MLKTVAVPVELSDHDQRVLQFVAGMSRWGVRRVVAIHVAQLTGMERSVALQKESELSRTLDSICAGLEGSDIDFECVLAGGAPAAAIVQTAAEHSADAIVLGTRAKTVLNEITLGSVSEELARTSTLPVMLVPFKVLSESSADDIRAMGAEAFSYIQHPTDFSDPAERMLDFIKSLAGGGVGRVLVSSIIDPAKQDESGPHERSARRILAGIQRELAESGIEADTELAVGNVVDEILRLSKEHGTTSFAMGSRGRTIQGELLLGSVSLSVMRVSGRPVLIGH